ncbi:MAG: hypothetical protein M1495_22725 [Bacteroidetes bacterium]|nr:hypothetical protein [Bacteroidota bacterium]
MKLQNWINPNLNLKPRYFGYKPNAETGGLERVEFKYPKFDVRLKFASVDLASKWVDIFRNELAALSGTNDYITVMIHDKPYSLTFAGNVDRSTGEIKTIVTFTLVEALRVIADVPEMAEVEAEVFPS